MKRIPKILTLLIFAFMPFRMVFAICPVCTIAVGAGVGLSRWLGIDDTITGVWVGALTVSIIKWTINWLDIKKIRFRGRKILINIGYYLAIVGPLYWKELIGHPLNKLWGVDKLILGILMGSILFFGGAMTYDYLKKKRGRASFYFQKVVMPIAPLIIASIIFYFITK